MPLPIVSPTLFNAHALPADPADTHLQPGIHLRVDAHPLLGLPVAPYIVWRAVLRDARQIKLRDDAVFVDSRGRVLTAPFTLTPDNPVTAHLALAAGQTCIWARVIADPAGGEVPGQPAPLTVGPNLRRVATRLDRSRLAPSAGATQTAAAGGIAATAFVTTLQGPAAVATRTAPPYAFAAPGIVQITLQGRGTVVGVTWLEQRDIGRLDWVPFTLLNLPHKGGPRYLPIANPIVRAQSRVLAQAPRRRPLQETLGMLPPALSPGETPLWEVKRVNSLALPLQPDLDRLITDLSVSPLEMTTTTAVSDDRGRPLGDFTQRCLDRVFQSRFDPGCAALFGHKALDQEFADPAPLLVFYWVAGFFQDFQPASNTAPADPFIDALLAQIGTQARFPTSSAWVGTWVKLASGLDVPLDKDLLKTLQEMTGVVGLGAIAVADRSASPAAIQPPSITAHRHVGWVPMPVPNARRELELQLAGVGVAALLAAEKQTPDGGAQRDSLHKVNGDGFHLPLVLGRNAADEAALPPPAPGTGQLCDRKASADTIRYGVAQQDSFGRWSDWATVVNPPGPRPRPPRPVFRAMYSQPANAAVAGGAVRVIVEVPPLASLAPASFAVREFELQVTDLTTTGVSTETRLVATPLAPPATLDFTFSGPLLAATEVRKLRLVARWRDTASQLSEPSEPAVITMNDPRPPPQISVPNTLMYSGRPDVTGLSSVEYSWTPAAGQANVAIWYSDENRLVRHLGTQPAGSAEATLAAALGATSDPAARATLIRSAPALVPDHLFERLQGVVFDGAPGQKTFRHAVSGSLRVLNVYRIAAESASGARVALTSLPLLIFAVPNADPPPRPVLEIKPAAMADNDATYAAEIRITLTKGMTEAVQWRLRRSLVGAGDLQRMPVVGLGAMGAPDAKGRQTALYVDQGPVQISPGAKLKPWLRYYWVAEAQGAPAPGSVAAGRPVPGAWGSPSDPVSAMLVPPQPPAAVTALAAAGTAGAGGGFVGVLLAFTHPHGLAGGALGPYKLRVMRRDPGAPLRILGVVELEGEGPYSVSGMDPSNAADEAPTSSVYRVVVIDPIGRESAAAETVLA
jgi:hypothetical protein